ncbi:MAG: HD domain-containing protein [Bacteroidetes bacterium]|nr:HD domain-containing protein [Bacteroidota bacterium]
MSKLIESIKNSLQNQLKTQEGSHDWQHILRVYNMALHLQSIEGGNREIVELAALLHDVSDHKYNGGNFDAGWQVARQVILDFGGTKELANGVSDVVKVISFKGALVEDSETSLEGKIVRDADRLDAIGAIGIARAFAYGGSKHRPLFNPSVLPILHQTKESYANGKSHSINHFYEKLLLLKDRMETKTAKDIARERQVFMLYFLKQYFKEEGLSIEGSAFDLSSYHVFE